MDLGTVKKKLERRDYKSENDIKTDIDLIWSNCKRYNQPGSDIFRTAEKMERHFKILLQNNANPNQLRKRPPQSEGLEMFDEGTLATKVQFFKKIKELDGAKLRELIQELVRKHPGCIKEVRNCDQD